MRNRLFHILLKLHILLTLSVLIPVLLLSGCGNIALSDASADAVTIATSGEPYRFFPQSKGGCGGDDNLVLCNLYDCLFRLENDGSLSPALATSCEESEVGLSYTFKIREGVTFHNGYPLTADDVKFTFDLGSEGPLGKALFINYESSEVLDKYTVRINLSAPYSAFLYGASSRLGGIVSRMYYDKVGESGYMEHPIGTGPYKFVNYVSGDYTRLEANENYWNGTPEIKAVTVKIVSDPNTQILGLKNGDYDLVRNPLISTVSKFGPEDNCCFDVTEGTGPIILYLAEWSGPCKDINFRKALSFAIKKDDINTFIFENYSNPLEVSMCKMYGGYVDSGDGVRTNVYDPEKAAYLLGLSEYSGEAFEITVPSESQLERIGKVIQAELLDIGINCKLRTVDSMSYNEAQNSRNYDSILIENISSLIDADSLSTLHRLDRWDDDHCYGRDAQIAALLNAGRSVPDDERTAYYVDACNIIHDEAYEVPLLSDLITIAYSKRLSGVEAHCLNYCYFDAISFSEDN